MGTSLAVAFLLFSPAPTVLQEQEWKKAMAQCAAVEGTSDRLECFDSLARGVGMVVPEPKVLPESKFKGSASPGQWTMETVRDPVDDSTTVALALLGAANEAQLVLRCRQNKPEVYVDWARFLGSAPTPVVTRFGGAKAETRRWPISSDKKAAFFPGDKRLFIRQLLSVDRLVVQVTPFAESPMTEVFDVRGLPAVIRPLKETCNLQ